MSAVKYFRTDLTEGTKKTTVYFCQNAQGQFGLQSRWQLYYDPRHASLAGAIDSLLQYVRKGHREKGDGISAFAAKPVGVSEQEVLGSSVYIEEISEGDGMVCVHAKKLNGPPIRLEEGCMLGHVPVRADATAHRLSTTRPGLFTFILKHSDRGTLLERQRIPFRGKPV
jgi:hypothetical protein